MHPDRPSATLPDLYQATGLIAMHNPSISDRALQLSTLEPRPGHDSHFFAQITIANWRKEEATLPVPAKDVFGH